LAERLVSVGREHDVDCLSLTRLQNSAVRPHLEAFTLDLLGDRRAGLAQKR
jgi:hypothetical protein